METTKYFNCQDLSKRLGTSYPTAYKLTQEYPEIGFFIGKRRFFTTEDVEKLKAIKDGKPERRGRNGAV